MRQLTIDWNGLHSAFQMNMPEVRCFLSADTGQVLKLPPGDQRMGEVLADRSRNLPIEAVPSRIQYQWLDEFIKTIEEDALRARMEAAVNGKGAFRRFKDILMSLPDERRRWFEFRDIMMRTRIIEWIREQGIEPVNEPDWGAPPQATSNTQNEPQNIDALRDFLIEWAEGVGDDNALSPINLEKLAQQVGERFRIRAKND